MRPDRRSLGDVLREVGQVVATTAPEEPTSRRPLCSAMTVTDRRMSGRTSAASTPLARATSTTSYSQPRPYDLHDAGLFRAGASLDVFKQGHLGGAVHGGDGVGRRRGCGWATWCEPT